MKPEAPRILVLSHNPFSWNSNNGRMLSSLFLGWPPDRLALIYIPFATRIDPSFDVCPTAWALTPRGIVRSLPKVSASPEPKPASKSSRFKKLIGALAQSQFVRRVAPWVREKIYAPERVLRGAALDEVVAFKPDLIVSYLGTLHCCRIALELSERLGAPIVPFITDDWITTEYKSALGGAGLRSQLQDCFDKILHQSPARFAGSPSMAEGYTERYHIEWTPFATTLDDIFLPEPHTERSGPLQLVYAGQLELDRWRSLEQIGIALARLSKEGVSAMLTVYAPQSQIDLYGDSLQATGTIRPLPYIDPKELPKVYHEADVLVHVESFLPHQREYTRFSLSTKLSEYLLSGRAIFFYGPEGCGSERHVRASSGGEVVGTEAPERLEESLRRLLTDGQHRETLARLGREFGLKNHLAVDQRRRFAEALINAAAASKPQ